MLLRYLATAMDSSVQEHCFHHMDYGQGAGKQDMAPARISLDFLIFSCSSQSSEGEEN